MEATISRILDDLLKASHVKQDREELSKVVFYRPSSIRLNYTGYLLLRRLYKEHKFSVSALSNADLIQLYRTTEFPYYIGGTYIVIFDGEEAFAITLSGGIKEWLNNG